MQVEHKTEKGTICFQKVKDNHAHFELAKLADYDPDDYLYLIADESFTKLPPGKWKLIGLTSEVTEDQAKMMVDETLLFKKHNVKSYQFKSYIHGFMGFETALDSFKYLMQLLQVYEVNPFEKPNINDFKSFPFCPTGDCKAYHDLLNEWQQANERTGKWVTLFKPNEK